MQPSGSNERRRRPDNQTRSNGYGEQRFSGEWLIENIDAIRKRARKHIEEVAVTDAYRADRSAVVSLLNDALATELVCVLRYKRHYFMANELNAEPAANEFLEHANEERAHGDALAARRVQLGGEPAFSPNKLASRSHAEYVARESLREMLREDLIAERIAIGKYEQIIRYTGDEDPTTAGKFSRR